jgi:hypothetical protein
VGCQWPKAGHILEMAGKNKFELPNPKKKWQVKFQPRTQGLSSWGAKTLGTRLVKFYIDIFHLICLPQLIYTRSY